MQHSTSIVTSKQPHYATLHSLCPSCWPKGLACQKWARPVKNWGRQRSTNIHNRTALYIEREISVCLTPRTRTYLELGWACDRQTASTVKIVVHSWVPSPFRDVLFPRTVKLLIPARRRARTTSTGEGRTPAMAKVNFNNIFHISGLFSHLAFLSLFFLSLCACVRACESACVCE